MLSEKTFQPVWSSWELIKNSTSSVIRQKGESQNGCFKKTKHVKFSEKTNISTPLIGTRTCAYQGVRNVCFFGKFGVFCFLETPVLRFALLSYYGRFVTISTFISMLLFLNNLIIFSGGSLNYYYDWDYLVIVVNMYYQEHRKKITVSSSINNIFIETVWFIVFSNIKTSVLFYAS